MSEPGLFWYYGRAFGRMCDFFASWAKWIAVKTPVAVLAAIKGMLWISFGLAPYLVALCFGFVFRPSSPLSDVIAVSCFVLTFINIELLICAMQDRDKDRQRDEDCQVEAKQEAGTHLS